MPRVYRKRTDIQIPEPRHRVGPKGVSSGISFRNLPPPSLDEIKKVCEHYQVKCAGTYRSLASRYLYQMAHEIELLVDSLKDCGFQGNDQGHYFDTIEDDIDSNLAKKIHATKNSHIKGNQEKRNVSFGSKNVHGSRPCTTYSHRDKRRTGGMTNENFLSDFSSHDQTKSNAYPVECRDAEVLQWLKENSSRTDKDSLTYIDLERKNNKIRRWLKEDSSRVQSYVDSLAHLNLEGQNAEVLRWLKEEIQRSQSLLDRSRFMHNAELVTMQDELKRVKKAAKLLIKAVHRKGKEEAAKSKANAEMERLRRLQSHKMIESLIQSHTEQIDLLKKGLVVDSPDIPWNFAKDDTTDISFGLTESSDLTSILDGLAEESLRRTKVVDNPRNKMT